MNKKQVFLDKLKETGRIKLSALYAGTTGDAVQQLMDGNPGFKDEVDSARDEYTRASTTSVLNAKPHPVGSWKREYQDKLTAAYIKHLEEAK